MYIKCTTSAPVYNTVYQHFPMCITGMNIVDYYSYCLGSLYMVSVYLVHLLVYSYTFIFQTAK